MRDRSRPKGRNNTQASSQVPPQRPQGIPLARNQQGKAASASPRVLVSVETELEVSGVYIISVAARILDMHPQTLRKYERLGLINPDRTGGMLRLYSREDIRKIMLIRHLMDNLGLNLAGVEFVLTLVDNLLGMRERLSAVAEGSSLKATIDQEMSQLFRNLNLPPEEQISE
jgi:MerR family transcriptional regulator/heat shock protein HspR